LTLDIRLKELCQGQTFHKYRFFAIYSWIDHLFWWLVNYLFTPLFSSHSSWWTGFKQDTQLPSSRQVLTDNVRGHYIWQYQWNLVGAN